MRQKHTTLNAMKNGIKHLPVWQRSPPGPDLGFWWPPTVHDCEDPIPGGLVGNFQGVQQFGNLIVKNEGFNTFLTIIFS